MHKIIEIFADRAALHTEILALRQQVAVLKRQRPRPSLRKADRVFWVILSCLWPGWRHALVIVRPETVIGWHRKGFRLFWTWKSRRRKPGRPPVSREIRHLVRRMSRENTRWGAPRIHGELLKLGFSISQAAVSKYMVRYPSPPSQSWRTFLTNHADCLASIDFFVVPTATFHLLFGFIVLHHERRQIVHFGVTANPTMAWVAQQIREAFPWGTAPRYLIRDRDGAYGQSFRSTVTAMGVEEVVTAPRSPWQNPYVERLIGSVRRECLDHSIILNERQPGWRPGKGNDKGKVEGLVGFIRRNFLVPVPRAESFAALNDALAEQCRRRQAARLRGHKETIGERLERDRQVLLPLPPAPYDACDKRPGRASSLSLVRYRSNDYSVPVAYGHREVLIRGYVDEVVISCGAEVIARHRRSYDSEDLIFDPLHYLPLIEQKIGALDQAAPLAGWDLPEVFITLRRLLEARMGKAGKREYVQVLRLLETFRLEEVEGAVGDALRLGAIGFDAVKHLVLCRIERRPPRLNLDVYPYLPRARVAMTSAKSYMSLLSGLGA